MAPRRGTASRKVGTGRTPRRRTSPRKATRKKTARKKTVRRAAAVGNGARKKAHAKQAQVHEAQANKRPGKRTVGYRPSIVGTLPARVLRWTPAKAVVTFPYRAYCWASDVAEEYRAFAISLDQ